MSKKNRWGKQIRLEAENDVALEEIRRILPVQVSLNSLANQAISLALKSLRESGLRVLKLFTDKNITTPTKEKRK